MDIEVLTFDDSNPMQEDQDIGLNIPEEPQAPAVAPQPKVLQSKAIFDVPTRIEKPFAELCGIILHGIAMAMTNQGGDVNQNVAALMALPRLLTNVAGKREQRRAVNVLNNIINSDSPSNYTLIESKRVSSSLPPLQRNDIVSGDEGTDIKNNLYLRKRVQLYVSAGLPGKALRVIESTNTKGVAPINPHTIQVLENLHPTNPDDRLPIPHGPVHTPTRITSAELTESLDSTPRLSASGISGWTFELIRVAVSTERGLHSATTVLNQLFFGKGGESYTWTSSRLIPLWKSNNGIRPIAIPEAWTRLLGRILSTRYASSFEQVLSPIQTGIGVKGGVEIVAHFAQQCSRTIELAATSTDPHPHGEHDAPMLKSVDFVNAFNTVRRDVIHAQLQEHVPDLVPYFTWSYSNHSPLVTHGKVICNSCTGVRQGDPLGPAFFSLALHPVLLYAKECVPEVDISSYLDDILIFGPAASVRRAFNAIVERAATIGLHCNYDKSWELTTTDFQTASSTYQSPTAVSIPLGPTPQAAAAISGLLSDQLAIIKDVVTFPTHSALAMVRSCINARPTYWARTLSIHHDPAVFEQFDASIDAALLQLCGSTSAQLVEPGTNIRHLPFSMGGLGIRRLTYIREPAWCASYGEAARFIANAWPTVLPSMDQSNQHLRQLLPTFNRPDAVDMAMDDHTETDARTQPITQRSLTAAVDAAILQSMLADSSELSGAVRDWITSTSSSKHAIKWLFNPALPRTNHRFTDGLLKHALCMLLLQPVVAATDHLTCICKLSLRQVDCMIHCLSCNAFRGLRTQRHTEVVDRLYNFLRSCNIAGSSVEKEASQRMSDNSRRSIDIKWNLHGEQWLFDVQVTRVRSSEEARANIPRCGGADRAEVQKRHDYEDVLAVMGLQPHAFKPFVLEVTATQGRSVQGEIWDLLQTKLTGNGVSVKEARKKVGSLYQSIASIVWKYNGLMVQALANQPHLAQPSTEDLSLQLDSEVCFDHTQLDIPDDGSEAVDAAISEPNQLQLMLDEVVDYEEV